MKESYPSKMCVKCLEVTAAFYNFVKTSCESQLALQQWIQKLKNSSSAGSAYSHPHDRKTVPSSSSINSKTETNDAPKVIRLIVPGGGLNAKIEPEECKIIQNLKLKRQFGKLFQCSHCSKRFMSKAFLIQHQRRRKHLMKRLKIGGELCAQCPKAFKNTERLSLHMVSQHNVSNRNMYLCTSCGKALSSLTTLKRHERIHEGKLDYNCSLCNAGFAVKTSLKRHIRVHLCLPPDQLFPCDLCSKTFRSKSTLDRHSLWHSGEKPFSCKVCQKSFFTVNEQKRHERKSHDKNAILHECMYCEKKFSELNRLKMHIMYHKNVRPFQCSICSSSYIERSRFKRHLKNQHSIEDNETEVIWKDPDTFVSWGDLMEM